MEIIDDDYPENRGRRSLARHRHGYLPFLPVPDLRFPAALRFVFDGQTRSSPASVRVKKGENQVPNPGKQA
jgi:hypothetical protein